MGHIRGTDRSTVLLFPGAIDDYITADNPVRFIDAFVVSLDLAGLGFARATPAATGRPAYDPADLLKLYLYGYLNRVRSSRMLGRETARNVEVMWLLGRLTPDFKTIADFRKDNLAAIKAVCRQFTLLCKRLDLFGGELVAIDGSKFRAVNGRKRNFNRAGLARLIRQIDEKVAAYLTELERRDEHEPAVDRHTAAELRAMIERLEEQRGRYGALVTEMEESGAEEVSLTGPGSRLMLVEHPFGTMKRGMNQGYFLMRGLKKVAAEVSLTVLSYNIKRALNILGMRAMMEAVG
jgi:transposase